jgi:hypothetical protein
MVESNISTDGTLSGVEAMKIEEPQSEEVAAADTLEWKAGSREWLILGCLTVVTLVVVSCFALGPIQSLDVTSHVDNSRPLAWSRRN